MKFIADLHVHSKFSRATSKTLDLASIFVAARLKGIGVVATGDFTHPAWFAEINAKLVAAEPGFFRLEDELWAACEEKIPPGIHGEVRFVLVAEISNIYKKDGRVRKNHNLVFMPDLESCARFNQKLEKIGNIQSDGRPILGLDARNLLEIVMEVSEDAFLIPAHIWTPWFSVLGSKSGFESLQACFEDLTKYIFAVETGLSSDPGMNWQVSELDRMTLVSNSDAHSADKLGREANWFDTDYNYFGIRRALEFPERKELLGTFEFYAQEGKYHFDGHRKCGVSLSPAETRSLDGKCPECGKPLTLGVLNRVMQLADRRPGFEPPDARPYFSILPLREVLSQILRVGPNSKKVARYYRRALEKFGSEFDILHHIKPQHLNSTEIPLLGKAIEKMRRGRIKILPGFDGQFGKLQLFDDQEREQLLGQASLFAVPPALEHTLSSRTVPVAATAGTMAPEKRRSISQAPGHQRKAEIGRDLNAAQRQAVLCVREPLLIVAGPGTGKTRTLTHKAAYLMVDKKIAAEQILALTFTKRAATEMQTRLERLAGARCRSATVTTFHGLCRQLLAGSGSYLLDALAQRNWVREALAMVKKRSEKLSSRDLERALSTIASAKQQLLSPARFFEKRGRLQAADAQHKVYAAYQRLLDSQNIVDYEDLIFNVVHDLEENAVLRKTLRQRFRYILVDEYQDINYAQYRLIRLLGATAEQVCAIGDPNQSIYGFRGSNPQYFLNFMQDYPNARLVVLNRNYRSTRTILSAAAQVIKGYELAVDTASDFRSRQVKAVDSGIRGYPQVDLIEASSPRAEAVAVGRVIENMVGGLSLHSIDSGKVSPYTKSANRSFADFAVLYRTAEDGRLFSDVFRRAGIPHQVSAREHALDRGGVRDLLDLLKLVERQASLLDFEKVAGLHVSGRRISRHSWRCFKSWCFDRKLDLQAAAAHLQRFPVPGLSTAQQRELNTFAAAVEDVRAQIKDLPVARKLVHLSRHDDFPHLKSVFESDEGACRELKNLLAEAGQAGFKADAFLADISLRTDADLLKAGVEKVALMTMHAAKGLEFPVVFIAGCSQGNIPYIREKDEADVDEERRLLYVAMTRARERLFFTRAEKRRVYGQWIGCRISQFIESIDGRLIKYSQSGVQRPVGRTGVQLKLF